MIKKNLYKTFMMFISTVLIISLLCSCTWMQNQKQIEKADKQTEVDEIKKKDHIGNWYTGFCYAEDNDVRPRQNGEAYDVEIWVHVYENGSYTIRWFEPDDPEDVAEVFKYELVNSPYEIQEFSQLYYDKENDKLTVNVDGIIVTMDRIK